MDSFGERLKLLRLRKGMTQTELSKLLDISVSAVGMYERNCRQPNTELLIKISRVFSVSVDYLLGIAKDLESVEDLLKQIYDALASSDGLTYNGTPLGRKDTKKLFDAMNIAADVILNEKIRNAEEEL